MSFWYQFGVISLAGLVPVLWAVGVDALVASDVRSRAERIGGFGANVFLIGIVAVIGVLGYWVGHGIGEHQPRARGIALGLALAGAGCNLIPLIAGDPAEAAWAGFLSSLVWTGIVWGTLFGARSKAIFTGAYRARVAASGERPHMFRSPVSWLPCAVMAARGRPARLPGADGVVRPRIRRPRSSSSPAGRACTRLHPGSSPAGRTMNCTDATWRKGVGRKRHSERHLPGG